ncbi:hypothetical protein [Jatrophihabitans sp.]|uniref:hypothetical protein n=1 Tax=Jatrophihabitans sp. TaxID=1932789 RepID=UPI002F118C5D
MTDPRSAPAPGYRPGGSPGTDDVVARIESAAHDIAGVSEGPLAEARIRLDALHSELQGALADLDQA